MSNAIRPTFELACKLKSLGTQSRTDESNARHVAARPVEALNEAGLDRIERADEHDGNSRGCSLRRERCGRRKRRNQTDLLFYQFGRERRQSIILAVRQALCDRDVAVDDLAGFAQSLAKRCDPFGRNLRGQAAEESDDSAP